MSFLALLHLVGLFYLKLRELRNAGNGTLKLKGLSSNPPHQQINGVEKNNFESKNSKLFYNFIY